MVTAFSKGHLKKFELFLFNLQYPGFGNKSCPPKVQLTDASFEQVLQMEFSSKLNIFSSQGLQIHLSFKYYFISPSMHFSYFIVKYPFQLW